MDSGKRRGAKLLFVAAIASLSITILLYRGDSFKRTVYVPPPVASYQTITTQPKIPEVIQQTTEMKAKVETRTLTADEKEMFVRPNVMNLADINKKYSSAFWTNGCPNESPTAVDHGTCSSPRRKIVFVKVHKCGGSTFSSLLLRYGKVNKLNVALPRHTHAHYGYPKYYRQSFVHNYMPSPQYDVVASHMVYDRCYVQNDFPKKDFVYTAVLREPWSQFVSTLNYFVFPQFIPPQLNKPMLRNVLDHQERYAIPIPFRTPPDPSAKKNFFKNMMSTDLGFLNEQANNQSAIELFIKRLDKDFDLIMITEYYHESLVLLKRLMCWTMKDIFYLKLNSKMRNRIGVEKITEDMKQKHKKLDNVDYILYDHFKTKLETKIQKGQSLQDEVRVYRQLLDKIEKFCYLRTPYRSQSVLTFEKNAYMEETKITRTDCIEYKKMPSYVVIDLKKNQGATLKHIQNENKRKDNQQMKQQLDKLDKEIQQKESTPQKQQNGQSIVQQQRQPSGDTQPNTQQQPIEQPITQHTEADNQPQPQQPQPKQQQPQPPPPEKQQSQPQQPEKQQSQPPQSEPPQPPQPSQPEQQQPEQQQPEPPQPPQTQPKPPQ